MSRAVRLDMLLAHYTCTPDACAHHARSRCAGFGFGQLPGERPGEVVPPGAADDSWGAAPAEGARGAAWAYRSSFQPLAMLCALWPAVL